MTYELTMMIGSLGDLEVHGTDIASDVALALNLVEMVSIEGQELLLAGDTMGQLLSHWTVAAWGWHVCVSISRDAWFGSRCLVVVVGGKAADRC